MDRVRGQRRLRALPRARGDENGRRLGAPPPKPYTPPATPAGRINVTDPDSRVVKGLRGFMQGYNAQAVTNEHQIVIAAEVMTAGARLRAPRADARRRPDASSHAAGVTDTPGVLLADAGYWHQHQMQRDRRPRHPGADPARREQTQRRPAGLGRRPLRVHAQRARHRTRRRALPTTTTDDRARLRQHQVQPRHRSLPPTRQSRRPDRMAPDHRHPQPPQAPPTRPRSRLRAPRRPPTLERSAEPLTRLRRPKTDPLLRTQPRHHASQLLRDGLTRQPRVTATPSPAPARLMLWTNPRTSVTAYCAHASLLLLSTSGAKRPPSMWAGNRSASARRCGSGQEVG